MLYIIFFFFFKTGKVPECILELWGEIKKCTLYNVHFQKRPADKWGGGDRFCLPALTAITLHLSKRFTCSQPPFPSRPKHHFYTVSHKYTTHVAL